MMVTCVMCILQPWRSCGAGQPCLRWMCSAPHGKPSKPFFCKGQGSTRGMHCHGHGFFATGRTAGANKMSMSGSCTACRGPGPQPLTDNGRADKRVTSRSELRTPDLLSPQCCSTSLRRRVNGISRNLSGSGRPKLASTPSHIAQAFSACASPGTTTVKGRRERTVRWYVTGTRP